MAMADVWLSYGLLDDCVGDIVKVKRKNSDKAIVAPMLAILNAIAV